MTIHEWRGLAIWALVIAGIVALLNLSLEDKLGLVAVAVVALVIKAVRSSGRGEE
jgi:hypothetical protein